MARTCLQRRLSILTAASAVLALATIPLAVQAEDAPTADEVSAAVSDHTYQGSMNVADSGFAEYYADDGTIRGDGYAGKWRTEDGSMCFQYGDKPESCFDVRFNGPSMEMYKDGALDGNGMLIRGNPSNF